MSCFGPQMLAADDMGDGSPNFFPKEILIAQDTAFRRAVLHALGFKEKIILPPKSVSPEDYGAGLIKESASALGVTYKEIFTSDNKKCRAEKYKIVAAIKEKFPSLSLKKIGIICCGLGSKSVWKFLYKGGKK